MSNAAFVAWMILWPVAAALEKLLSAKQRMMEKRDPLSSGVIALTSVIEMGIWFFVGFKLFEGN